MTSTRSYVAVASRPGAGSRMPGPTAGTLRPLVENWWMMAGRGVLAIAFGAAIALWRIPVFDAIIVSFGTYAIADGILALASALRTAPPRTGWPIALEGVISVALGGLAFVWPLVPRGAIGLVVAWGVLTGICEIVAAVQLPRREAPRWLLGTGGVSSIFLALVVLALPHAGSDRVALALAAYAIVFGVVILVASLGFRRAEV